MTRKICVVTGTRAEYGCLRWLMDAIRSSPGVVLQVIVTGTHLSPEFGSTYREIEQDGFAIDRKIEMLLSSDTPVGVTKSMALAMIGFAEAYQQLQPDLIFVLGDRFEILSAAAAATIACIPVCHAHGGETTEGAFDEAIRHSVTKMSHLHFVATEQYRRRVIQLGEAPERVFLVGGLGIDNIRKLKLLDQGALEAALGIVFRKRSLLVTFHPATLDHATPAAQLAELLGALDSLRDTSLIFTMPNADTGGRVLMQMIDEFVLGHPDARAFASLGQLRYLSCIRQVDAVVGNSSSGLTEVPSFRKATINIGDRQRGRIKAASVIDCEPDRNSIALALRRIYAPEFLASLKDVVNLYGEGGASVKILQVLENFPLDSILRKSFHDLEPGGTHGYS